MEEFDEFYYYKKDLIGHGAFAIVYKGRSRTKNCDVAIKAIAKKNIPKTKSLLNKEIKILEELRELQHENLVALLKRVETTTQVYLVMEYCNGGDLADYLSTKVTISESIIQHFFSQIANGLEAMHKMGIVHRDLKPQNILLCSPPQCPNALPNQLIVKLADFGFARFLTNGGMAGTLCGSPMYMAPEVIMSLQYCAKADLWSVGTIMYQCLTGKAPFVAQTPQALKNFYERHRDLQPNIPEYCSPLLADLLLKLLKRNARDRIEFADFFVHPFLHKPLPLSQASPSRHISQQQHEYSNYHGSGSSGNRHHHHQAQQQPSATTAHLRAKYPPPISSPSSASNAVGGGLSRHYSYDQTQHHYGVSTATTAPVGGGASPRFVAVDGAAATRQAPLRPPTTAITPTVGVRGGPSGIHSSSRLLSNADTYAQYCGGFTAATAAASALSPQRQRTLSNEYADGASKALLSKQSSSPAVQYAAGGGPSNMSDSGDFTFLPPLMEKGGYSSQQQQQQQKHGSSSTLSGDNNPVRQVQVHSTASAAHVRAVPVPSQRYAFAKMEERRNGGVHHSSKSPHFQPTVGGSMPAMAEEKNGGEQLQQQPRIPSVEEINLPETHFVVHPLKSNDSLPSARIRRNTVNDFAATATTNASCRATIFDTSRIPKSATCATLGSASGSATARKFSVPSIEASSSITEKQPPVVDNIRYLSTSPRVGPSRIDEEEDAAVGKNRADETSVTASLSGSGGSATKVNFALGKRIMNEDDDDEEEEDDDGLHMEEPASFPFVGREDSEKTAAASAHNSSTGFSTNNFANNNDANMMDESLMSQVMESISGEDEELGVGGPASTTATAGGGILMSGAAAPNNGHSSSYQPLGASPKSNNHLLIDAEPPPELEPETLMDSEHRQVLAKLRFVLELIEALINVAENKTNPIAMMMEGGSRKLRHQSSSASTSSASRRAEQLVLYVRSLHVLSSALVMAQRQVNAETLQPSPAVQNVLNQLNEKYHHCLARSQELASLGIPGADPAMTVVSAERIMYQHAIDLCQSAALDELFGNPQLCPKRYQTAYMMLHTLSEQVQNEQDKCVLAKYKNAVEKRMRILERQGFVTAVHVNERGGGGSATVGGGLQKNSLFKENEPV